MSMSATISRPESGLPLRVGLWIAQVLAAPVFCFAGYTKLTTPIAQLSAMMPWAGSVSEGFVRFNRRHRSGRRFGPYPAVAHAHSPQVTLLAALGCIVLQVLAAGLHLSRGEVSVLPLNAVLLALSVFILWGRARKAPISPPLIGRPLANAPPLNDKTSMIMTLPTFRSRFHRPPGRLLVAAAIGLGLCIPYGFCARSQTAVSSQQAAPRAIHRILFHVASSDTAAMAHAISAADNAMKFYQARNESVSIEIVANGAGVRMMRADASRVAPSIAYLHQTYPAIVFSACGTMLRLMKEREGIEPPLLDGVRVTPAGIARIIELEEAG